MRIEFHRLFKGRYKKVSWKVRRQFDERLVLFEQMLYHSLLNNHPLTGDRRGQWSINVTGNWRAIYIWIHNDTVVFLDLDTHSNLYG